MSVTTEADEIRQELAVLSRRIAAIESRLGENGNLPAALDASQMVEVCEITARLFPGKCAFTSEFDPEFPDDRYVVVNVEAQGDAPDIVDRTCQWHERIRILSRELHDKLRLSVTPV